MSNQTAKHTPGPWARDDNDAIIVAPPAYFGDRVFIADLDPSTPVLVTYPSIEEMEANARLIAAAPELIAALRAIVERDTEFEAIEDAETRYYHAIGIASQAIARAEGRQDA